MSFYGLCDHIYMTQFRDDIILLDTKEDKYTICSNDISELLKKLLDPKKSNGFILNQSTKVLSNIQDLIDGKIIQKIDSLYHFYIDYKPFSKGVPNIDWILPIDNTKKSLSVTAIKAFIALVRVNFCLKFKGFYKGIQLIKKSCENHACYTIPTIEKLTDLANEVNQACMIYPKRTKCLEWAMTFVLMALKRGWKCNLEIGVQNYPFSAHAWVECGGKVVMDSQYLREGLSIVLCEPFRKLNT